MRGCLSTSNPPSIVLRLRSIRNREDGSRTEVPDEKSARIATSAHQTGHPERDGKVDQTELSVKAPPGLKVGSEKRQQDRDPGDRRPQALVEIEIVHDTWDVGGRHGGRISGQSGGDGRCRAEKEKHVSRPEEFFSIESGTDEVEQDARKEQGDGKVNDKRVV